ncbi:MAG: hypothetical protein U0797_22410 [Gemmataceae bacterium]
MSRVCLAEPPALRLGAGIDFSAPDSPLAAYYLRASDVVAASLLSFVFVLACVAPLPVGDVRSQLELGLETLKNGPWAQGPAVQLSWLFHAGLALLFRLGSWPHGAEGGVECLRGAYALLVVARLTLLWLAFRRVSGSAGLGLAGLVLTLGLSLGRLPGLHPLLFGEACFAAILVLLSHQELTRRRVQLLCATFVLWANVHESFVLGFVLLLIGLVARVISLGWAVGGDPFLRKLTGLILMSLIAILALNPRGPFLVSTLWGLAHDPAFVALEAWQPLRFHYGPGGQWTFLLLWCLVVLVQHLARTFYPPVQLLCLLVFGFWPLWHQQILLEWAMVAPWAALAVAPAAAERFRPAWLSSSVPSFRKTLLAGLFAVIAATWFAPVHWLMGGRPASLDRSLSQSR